MTSFNVLDRTESVHRHLLLEASAGTGKTFAIENIVVRLLLESKGSSPPLLIENILVVTFTRMAARELKERIHSNLQRNLEFLKRALDQGETKQPFPDYLLAHVELGKEAIRFAKKSIERALFSFDRAQIFTIHGFCWRMLKNYSMEAGMSLKFSSQEDDSLSTTRLMQVIRDFLKNQLTPSIYSPQQLKIITQRAKRDSKRLQLDLLNQMNRGLEIESPPAFFELLERFQNKMSLLRKTFAFEGLKILEDFLTLAPSYKQLLNKNKQVHPEKMAKAERFAALFDKQTWEAKELDILIEDGLFLIEAFDSSLLMAKAKQVSANALHYPNLLTILRNELEPLISQARSEASLFCRLASDCQKFVSHYQEQEEMFGHSHLLIQMRKAIDRPAFASRIRASYLAAIVDEFQDTDPIQWEIFSLLFASKNSNWSGSLNLVGDPKQSIYAFRQADIYTYLSAAETLGPASFATLDTNFRSRSSLIDALNVLFNSAEETFVLPKLSSFLPYRDVAVGRTESIGLADSEASLQFWGVKSESRLKDPLVEVETHCLLPAIAKELVFLKEQKGIRFGQCAILIADRFQASRVCHYLKTLEIPVKSQKGVDISCSKAVDEMRDLLNGVMNYSSKSTLNIALASRLIGMTHRELLLLENQENLFAITEQFNLLRKIFNEHGFAKFYPSFMQSSWHRDGKSVLERLLSRLDGLEFYREWEDLADLMISEEYFENLLPQGVIAFLDRLEQLSCNEDDRIKAYVEHDNEGVSVLTTHMSKGLEFDVVFALGLIKRTKPSDSNLIPLEKEKKHNLCAVENKDDLHYQKFCEESDAEKMRQLYVALTRSKEKLYVPFVIHENQKEIPLGSASPMELFLARLDKPKTDYKGLYKRLCLEDGSTISTLVAKFPTKMHVSFLNKKINPIETEKVIRHTVLNAPKEIKPPLSFKALQSFTSLAPCKNLGLPSRLEDLDVPHDFSIEEKTAHTLPSGMDTGSLFHKIFDDLPFDCARNLMNHSALSPLISPFLKGTPFASWEDVVTQMVFNALKTPLGQSGKEFCLSDLDSKKIFKEMPFFYPLDAQHKMFKGTAVKPGYLKGSMDVFFEHQGKYYLLDWKSNWLGLSNSFYGLPYLQEAMSFSRYDLQAAIYSEALKKYLKIFHKNPFEQIFGGVYYFFIRGLSPTTGIWHRQSKEMI